MALSKIGKFVRHCKMIFFRGSNKIIKLENRVDFNSFCCQRYTIKSQFMRRISLKILVGCEHQVNSQSKKFRHLEWNESLKIPWSLVISSSQRRNETKVTSNPAMQLHREARAHSSCECAFSVYVLRRTLNSSKVWHNFQD